MAGQESLGDAVLYLTVNDEALRNGIRDAKAYVRSELGQAFSAGTGGGRGRSSGTGGRGFSDRVQATQVITRRLGDQLQRLADKGIDVTKQFRALDRASVALNKGLVEVARAQNKGVNDFIRNEKKKKKESVGSTLQSPIRGSLRQPGSPIFSTRGASQGGARESIDALFQAQKRRYSLDQQIRSLENSGVKTDKLRESLGEVTAAQARREFGLAKQLGDQLSFNLRKERDRLRVKQQQARATEADIREGRRIGLLNRSPVRGGLAFEGSPIALEKQQKARADLDRRLVQIRKEQARKRAQAEREQRVEDLRIAGLNVSPVRGGVAFPGSPKALEAQRARRRRVFQDLQGRVSSGLVGGAFPLLFGQGAGAAIGGGLGGLAGGSKFGFGLSLVGTVLGQAFDEGVKKAQLLADSLDNPIAKFQELAQAGLISSKATEKQVAALLEVGREAEAAAVLEGDLTNLQVDPEKARELEEASRELSNTWTQFGLTIAAVGSGPLQDIINGFNKLLTGSIAGRDFSNLDKEIAAAVAAARKQVAAETRTGQSQALDLQIINAQADKDKLRTLELQKQKNVIDETNKLAVLGSEDTIRRSKVEFDFKKKNLQLERQISEEIKRRQVLQLKVTSATGAFGKTESQKAFEQVFINVTETLNRFGPASLEFKLALQEGANTLLNNAKAAAEQLRDANRGLRDLRLGNLRFLPARQRRDLIQEQVRAAAPEARRRGVALRGLSDVFNFNRFLEQEQSALQTRADAERNMTDANNNLRSSIITQTGALSTLTDVMNRLIDKSWAVYVNVPSQNGAASLNMSNQLN